jgi:hypothetical protein
MLPSVKFHPRCIPYCEPEIARQGISQRKENSSLKGDGNITHQRRLMIQSMQQTEDDCREHYRRGRAKSLLGDTEQDRPQQQLFKQRGTEDPS